jgi:hypothetical protein
MHEKFITKVAFDRLLIEKMQCEAGKIELEIENMEHEPDVYARKINSLHHFS